MKYVINTNTDDTENFLLKMREPALTEIYSNEKGLVKHNVDWSGEYKHVAKTYVVLKKDYCRLFDDMLNRC